MAELLKHWPWATIAAFMAVGVTLWVANSESRQRRRQLRQDAILNINFESSAWINAAGTFLASAAADLATIGSNVSAAHLVAAARTVAVVPAAADEVSTSIAHLFSQHAANYQALAGQAAAFNGQFVHNLTAGAFSYAGIEAKLAASLSSLLSLLPPGIQNNLQAALQNLTWATVLIASGVLLAAGFIGYFGALFFRHRGTSGELPDASAAVAAVPDGAGADADGAGVVTPRPWVDLAARRLPCPPQRRRGSGPAA
jgi:hypothetical protein